jgi:hypothetical protein
MPVLVHRAVYLRTSERKPNLTLPLTLLTPDIDPLGSTNAWHMEATYLPRNATFTLGSSISQHVFEVDESMCSKAPELFR